MRRNLLSARTIKAIQLQKNWLRSNAVSSELNELIEYVQTARSTTIDLPEAVTPS